MLIRQRVNSSPSFMATGLSLAIMNLPEFWAGAVLTPSSHVFRYITGSSIECSCQHQASQHSVNRRAAAQAVCPAAFLVLFRHKPAPRQALGTTSHTSCRLTQDAYFEKVDKGAGTVGTNAYKEMAWRAP